MDAVPNTFPALFYGYTAIWLILGVYIISLGFRLSRLEKILRDRSPAAGASASRPDGSPR
jgi:CcmD family protein